MPKALAALPRGTPLVRLLRAWPCPDDRPAVVTGAHHAEIARALSDDESQGRIIIVQNPHWARGRTGGLQAAVNRFPGQDLVVAPVDCPRIPRPVFEALLRAWQAAESPALGWCAPFLEPAQGQKKRYGHPILIGRALLQQVGLMDPDTPLRRLRSGSQPCFGVPVPHPEILEDLDTPKDLERLCEQDRQSP